MALSLALALRGPENYVITDEERLVVAAGELGISYEALTPTLRVLEEVDFARVFRNGDTIQRLEVSVPQLRESYAELGDFWRSSNPGEIEQATIALLDQLALGPMTRSAIVASFGISPSQLDMVIEVGQSAGYLDIARPGDDDVIYSPLFWEENPEKTAELLAKLDTEELRGALSKVRDYQGLPIERLATVDSVAGAIAGILPTTSVDSTGGEHQFTFTTWGPPPPR